MYIITAEVLSCFRDNDTLKACRLEAVLNFSKKFFLARQIARYLPHHRSENASKTHPKSSHDKFKTAS